MNDHEDYMRHALDLAQEAGMDGEAPVGCVITGADGVIIGRGRNRREKEKDATAHAELEAINDACKTLGDWRLDGCSLYVTLEPCPMCAGAVIMSRISKVFYGSREELTGSCGSVINLFMEPYGHRVQVTGGILESECSALLTGFFDNIRETRRTNQKVSKQMDRTTVSHAPLFLDNPERKGIVVFIHGFMGSPRQFDRLADAVYSEGFSVAALLLPGHGGAAKDFATGTFERWQNHVDAEIERLSTEYAVIWLVGHSMGGLLSINAAIKYSGHVRGVFPIVCPFKITTVSASSTKTRMKQILAPKDDPIKAAYLLGGSVKPSPSLLWYTAAPAVELKKLMTAARGNLPLLSVPVTAVYSTSDELTSIESLEILKTGLTGAPFDCVVLSESLHAYYPEHEYAIIEQALIRFVSS